ncbi:putative ABC transport system ATP-binding protein [Pustulibacterium marinum]|uniref:Putative ABC transport system ATP-binding protein n=1 Tax=Pustulibacterium marinum TaxID=1224947 RepID=A0A1I7IT61_9FLAO|nr:ATP-binding cassette domain-containing protein [Pustulibacterium marinum]SFU76116.1 putative ABC transport system ATP-binding protein [Pustulibacterium marinum]
MIQTQALTFQYSKKAPVFTFPNISLSSSEHLLIIGQSGIGKTTFLHLLAGLLSPKSGSIKVGTTNLEKLSQKDLDRFRGDKIGFVFQRNHALKTLTVLENLQLRLRLANPMAPEKQITALLQTLQLTHVQHQKPHSLSLGQLQRLGIAMALVHHPKLILADEPTSSLDDENCKMVMELLLKQAEEKQSNLIVITHDHRIMPYFSNVLKL